MNQDLNPKVICLESIPFYQLVEEVVGRLSSKNEVVPEKWINDDPAMKLLNISARSTLQKSGMKAKFATANLHANSFSMIVIQS